MNVSANRGAQISRDAPKARDKTAPGSEHGPGTTCRQWADRFAGHAAFLVNLGPGFHYYPALTPPPKGTRQAVRLGLRELPKCAARARVCLEHLIVRSTRS